MTCNNKEKVLAFLKGNLPEEEREQVEEHIEACPACSGIVEGYLEKEQELEIPHKGFEGKEAKLKEQAVHYRKGTRRIVIFTVVGMVMGWFSRGYLMQEFFPVKLILCIPYKISEVLYRAIGGWGSVNASYLYEYWKICSADMRALFPMDALVRLLAEYITPVLIGGAIYGSLAYFTGDKRIFTLLKYLKFAAVWLGVISLYAGSMFALYHVNGGRAERLENIEGFMLSTENGAQFFEVSSQTDNQWGEALRAALFADGSKPQAIAETEITMEMSKAEIPLEIISGTYSLYCLVNTEEEYLRTYNGTNYRIPQEFAAMLRAYYEKASLRHYEEETQTWHMETRPPEEIWGETPAPSAQTKEAQ